MTSKSFRFMHGILWHLSLSWSYDNIRGWFLRFYCLLELLNNLNITFLLLFLFKLLSLLHHHHTLLLYKLTFWNIFMNMPNLFLQKLKHQQYHYLHKSYFWHYNNALNLLYPLMCQIFYQAFQQLFNEQLHLLYMHDNVLYKQKLNSLHN